MGTLDVGIYAIHGPRDDARIAVEFLMNWKGDFKIVSRLGMPFTFPYMVCLIGKKYSNPVGAACPSQQLPTNMLRQQEIISRRKCQWTTGASTIFKIRGHSRNVFLKKEKVNRPYQEYLLDF